MWPFWSYQDKFVVENGVQQLIFEVPSACDLFCIVLFCDGSPTESDESAPVALDWQQVSNYDIVTSLHITQENQ